MRKILSVSVLGVGVALVLASSVVAQGGQRGPIHLPVGADAPMFALKAADGKDYSLKEMTETGSVFVLFWKEVCPHNARSAALFNNMFSAYEGKARLVGIVGASPDGTKKFAEQFAIKYPLLSDADFATIRAYQMRYSIGTLEIDKEGKIVNVYPGYGSETMTALNAAMAKAAGADVKDVDLTGAPGRLTWG